MGERKKRYFLDLLRRKRSAAIVRAPACQHYRRPQKHLDFDEERDRELEAKLSLSEEMADHLAENAGPTAVMWVLIYWSRETPILSCAGKAAAGSMPGSTSGKAAVDRQQRSELCAAQPVARCKFAR